MKDQDTVIQEFNDIVNMSALELEDWLKSEDSQSAGWTKEDGDGESVGHDSGRNIISILKSNPDKTPDKYTEQDVEHMRKVVSYCKRHLAQEEKANSKKSAAEVKKTKSYASLKNWGHDLLKKQEASNGDEKQDKNGEKHSGEKRKGVPDGEDSANKKRETEKGKSHDSDGSNKDKEETNGKDTKANGHNQAPDAGGKNEENKQQQQQEEEEEEEEEEEVSEEDADEEPQPKSAKDKGKSGSNGASKGPDTGDSVSWNWGNGQAEGKVLDVKEDTATVKTKKGNQVSRHGDSDNPAVVLDTGKSKAIKLSNELNET
ncbi:hypothetical protein CDD82_3725 [Ophiocordyceps australis]|uniref:Hypervirulence associated protein TUDOR domain-containing protein n=1 Tax=Ophiocordyceps australis TaxID=1399860 RepID=A0A2C5ZPQ5_9HYPO|nr:hypothetical protein CDD82_3725 [Ophiocordyceps australis]